MDYIYPSLSDYPKDKIFEHLSDDLWVWHLSELIRRGQIYSTSRGQSSFIVSLSQSIPLFISRQMLEKLDYTKQDFEEGCDHLLRNITHPDDATFYAKMSLLLEPILIKHCKQGRRPYVAINFTMRLIRKNGSVIPFECNMYPMAMRDGRSVFSMVYVQELKVFRSNVFQAFLIKENVRYIYMPRADKLVLEEKIILKPTEHEILTMVAKGIREQSIAKKLNIDVNMVKYHKKNIMEKLSVYSMPQAVYYALRNGIL
ncbi:MAG: LuxR C-terminal-related transcriptional regulator [Tannerellaceae bacterium]